GEMERHYSPGRTWEATCRAFAGMLRLGDVLDLGSGDGTIAELLAPRARSYCCLDLSPRVIDAAKRRLRDMQHARFVCADMHALPLRSDTFDQALLFNALACANDPARVLGEASRVLRPGGELVIVTLDAHEQMETTAAYGHVQPGFTPASLRALLQQAGLHVRSCEVSSRERRSPRFGVVTALADKLASDATADRSENEP
ncbi:MAG: class I SAM-dependent methyltransferase, partial [Polyangiales bacterium]